MTIHIGYSPAYLDWTGSHASPQRAYLAVKHIKAEADNDGTPVNVIIPSPAKTNRDADRERLKEIHDPQYIDDLFDGRDLTHPGEQGSYVAPMMFAGTRALAQEVVRRGYPREVFFNPQGAKHHAAYAHSAGFCALNDMAWAAKFFTDQGKRVAYLDWDVHHGDGVEDLTLDNPNVLTISIHQQGIYPGTGNTSRELLNAYNFPLTEGDGDTALWNAVRVAIDKIQDFGPDVLLLAIGADGLTEDPLGGLKYTIEGLTDAAHRVGEMAHDLGIPVLAGGAGGYTPFTYTPVAWAQVVLALNAELTEN
jgi:acetoin utilization protein AcuC